MVKVSESKWDRLKRLLTPEYIERRVPGGEWRPGREGMREYWVCSPLRDDDRPNSFSIREDGLWHDFATGESGNLVQLFASMEGLEEDDCLSNVLAELEGTSSSDQGQDDERCSDEPIERTPPQSEPVRKHGAIPFDPEMLPDLTATVVKYCKEKGWKFEKLWPYSFTEGKIEFAIARAVDALGDKKIRPWLWNGSKWEPFQPLKDGRPLLRLPELLKSTLPVLVVEGEKCADVSVPGYFATTWAGGANAVSKTDWSPLANRTVVVWPDADEPGIGAAKRIKCPLPRCGLRKERKLPNCCSWGFPEEGREIGHGILYAGGPHPTPEPTQYLYSTVLKQTITPTTYGGGGGNRPLRNGALPAELKATSIDTAATTSTIF